MRQQNSIVGAADWIAEMNRPQGRRQTRVEAEQASFDNFVKNCVDPAFSAIVAELEKCGRTVTVRHAPFASTLRVCCGPVDEINFKIYSCALPNSIFPYVEIKMKERSGLRVNRTDTPLKPIGPGVSIDTVSADDVVTAFNKYYAMALNQLGES